jgi:hypothetical protein
MTVCITTILNIMVTSIEFMFVNVELSATPKKGLGGSREREASSMGRGVKRAQPDTPATGMDRAQRKGRGQNQSRDGVGTAQTPASGCAVFAVPPPRPRSPRSLACTRSRLQTHCLQGYLYRPDKQCNRARHCPRCTNRANTACNCPDPLCP